MLFKYDFKSNDGVLKKGVIPLVKMRKHRDRDNIFKNHKKRWGSLYWITSDGGATRFFTIVCPNTGDEFYIGEGLIRLLDEWYGQIIRDNQSIIDNMVKQNPAYENAIKLGISKQELGKLWTSIRDRMLVDNTDVIKANHDKEAAQRIIDDEIANLHTITGLFMAAFDMRVVSYLNIKEMTKRGGSINTTVRRRLMCGHGKFRNLLLRMCAHPAAPRNDGVLFVTEHHTSHLCSSCYRFNGYVGSSRSFKCPGCLSF